MRLGFTAWIVALAACSAGSDAGAGAMQNRPRVPGIATVRADGRAPDETPGPAVSYAAAIQRSSHNSYERLEPLLDQLVYHRIRSIELDIHAGKSGDSAASGDWFVYHEDLPLFRDTSCARLSDCLGQLAAFHRAFPRHEVVTLFVDLKDRFESGHSPADLDALLAKALGRANVFGPEDARKRCPTATTLRDSLAGSACTFPTLHDLRGKFVVATTGGSACDPASPVMGYDGVLAFRAPNFSKECTPPHGDDVFVNLSWNERAQATTARNLGLVTRVYKGGTSGGLDTMGEFDAAIAQGALHAATDETNAEARTWSSTHDGHGFPFRCAGCEGHVETASIIGLRATSGDLWDAADSGFFALTDTPAPATEDTWTALAAVPSSHAPEFAKACLVARASDAPGAAYAAACRTFDANAPRMQVRAADGATTTTTTAPASTGLAAHVPAFLRLRITPNGTRSSVVAESSPDGQTWATIGATDLDARLPLRGLAVSSHDDVAVKTLFGDVRRNGGSVAASVLSKRLAIGAGANGEAFAGVMP